MTSTELHLLFDLVKDKNDAPYFTQDEKDFILNLGQIRLINNLIFKDFLGDENIPRGPQSLHEIEDKIMSSIVLQPLIIIDESATPVTGKIATSGLTNMMHFLSMRRSSDDLPVRYIRSDVGKFFQNFFKKPSSSKVYYRLGKGNIYIYPSDNTDEMKLSYLSEPDVIEYGVTDSNLPYFTHIDIVAYALDIAGVASYELARETLNNETAPLNIGTGFNELNER